jgi:hypothetical protein
MSDDNKEINDLTEVINLNKKAETEVSGLTETDLRSLLHIMSHVRRLDASYVKMIPSVEVSLPSGLAGHLVWKPKVGYVFALDLVSSLKM